MKGRMNGWMDRWMHSNGICDAKYYCSRKDNTKEKEYDEKKEGGERAEGRRKGREFCGSLANVVITGSASQWMQNHSGDVDLETSPHSAQEGESKGSGSVFQMPSA